MRPSHRFPALAVLSAALLVAQPVLAFQTPLSDESIREAYFLGQRHDGSFEKLLDKNTRHLQAPKTGPYVSSITFVTPFLNAAELSNSHLGSYSAQQEALDYRAEGPEIVRIVIEIRLTESYSQFVSANLMNPRRGDGHSPVLRSDQFWTDFREQAFDGERPVEGPAVRGHSNYSCGEGGCVLTGATLELNFPADAFSSDSAIVRVDPPEGPTVSAIFELTALR